MCSNSSNVILEDESVDDQHCAMVIDEDRGLLLIDLKSEYGTKLNSKNLKELIPEQLQIGDEIKFGHM